jgi:hypothetical protein
LTREPLVSPPNFFRCFQSPFPRQGLAPFLSRCRILLRSLSHNAVIAPAGVLASHSDDQVSNFTLDSRPPRIAPVLETVKLLSDEPAIPSQNGIGLSTRATCFSALQPSRLPISATWIAQDQ